MRILNLFFSCKGYAEKEQQGRHHSRYERTNPNQWTRSDAERFVEIDWDAAAADLHGALRAIRDDSNYSLVHWDEELRRARAMAVKLEQYRGMKINNKPELRDELLGHVNVQEPSEFELKVHRLATDNSIARLKDMCRDRGIKYSALPAPDAESRGYDKRSLAKLLIEVGDGPVPAHLRLKRRKTPGAASKAPRRTMLHYVTPQE